MYGRSTLIVGNNDTRVREEITRLMKNDGIKSLSDPDILELGSDLKSIGISEIRKARTFLSKRPLRSKRKILLILNAEKLTVDAQNALLKLLEEPSKSTHLILSAVREENLLDTIRSRCRKITVTEDFSPDRNILEMARKFAESGVGERLFFIESNKQIFTERDGARKFLDHLCYFLRSDLSLKKAKMAQKALKLQRDLSNTNVNVRLAMEYLAVT